MPRTSKAAVGDDTLKVAFAKGFKEGRPEEESYRVEITVGSKLVFKGEFKLSEIGEVLTENIVRHAGESMEIFVSPIYVETDAQGEVEDGIEEAEVVEEE